jgi:hypothetical protein
MQATSMVKAHQRNRSVNRLQLTLALAAQKLPISNSPRQLVMECFSSPFRDVLAPSQFPNKKRQFKLNLNSLDRTTTGEPPQQA